MEKDVAVFIGAIEKLVAPPIGAIENDVAPPIDSIEKLVAPPPLFVLLLLGAPSETLRGWFFASPAVLGVPLSAAVWVYALIPPTK